MKATDIIQPIAMATPIAVSGSKDTIPQEQADVEYPWYCSIEEGFPDITMTALNQGGRPPRGQGMNGLLNLISDQKVYLQNGGILTFKQSVSDTIGGYPQGAVLDYMQGNTYAKVISLIDDNTVNFLVEGIDNTNWKLLDFGGGSSEEGANTDLSNLTDNGNAKFQYAPFSINNGTVDTDGNNATLSTVGDVPVQVDKYVVPVLSSNNSEYGTCNDYTMTGTKAGSWSQFTNPWTIELAQDNYIPSGATVVFTIKTGNSGYNYTGGAHYYAAGCTGCKITYTYTDNTTEKIFDENLTGNFSGWSFHVGNRSATITLPVTSKTIKSISVTGYASFGQDYNYYNAWGITFKAQYTASSADTLICSPCTITTADSRTKTFTTDYLLDCSSVNDGTYKVMKSYTDGNLSLVKVLSVSQTEPSKIKTWTQPVLISSGTVGGVNFAVEASSNLNDAYLAFDGNVSTGWASNSSDTEWFTFYNPRPLNVVQLKINITNIGTYSVEGSNDNSDWITLKPVSSIAISGTTTLTVDLSNNTNFYKYYRITIGRNTRADVIHILNIDITAVVEVDIDSILWLNTSSYPLTLNQYNGTAWQTNNNLVYIGDVTVSNGVITAISNNNFNKYSYLLINNPIQTYQNGTSWYRVHPDGWCEQGGLSYAPQKITLLKTYKDTDYTVITSSGISSISTVGGVSSKTTSSFTLYLNSASGTSYVMYWFVCGYLAEGEY